MTFEPLLTWVVRSASWAMTRNQLLHVPHRSALRGCEPFSLRRLVRDPCQLAHRRPAHLPVAKRQGHLGQLLERLRHAQLLLGQSRGVPEQSLHVLDERTEAQPHVGAASRRRQEPAPLFQVQAGSRLCQTAKLEMRSLPPSFVLLALVLDVDVDVGTVNHARLPRLCAHPFLTR
jgi:hypothetical protein